MGELRSVFAMETHIATVIVHCMKIKLGFGNVGFWGEKKIPGDENRRQFQPSMISNQKDTYVSGQRSQHLTLPFCHTFP